MPATAKKYSRAVTAYGEPRTVPTIHMLTGGNGWHKLSFFDVSFTTSALGR